jgi:hypothetical protein
MRVTKSVATRDLEEIIGKAKKFFSFSRQTKKSIKKQARRAERRDNKCEE